MCRWHKTLMPPLTENPEICAAFNEGDASLYCQQGWPTGLTRAWDMRGRRCRTIREEGRSTEAPRAELGCRGCWLGQETTGPRVSHVGSMPARTGPEAQRAERKESQILDDIFDSERLVGDPRGNENFFPDFPCCHFALLVSQSLEHS